MLAYIKGEIISKGTNFVIIVTSGLGYKIFVNDAMLGELSVATDAELYLHHHVREDAVALYGFFSLDQLEMFELLLSVSGVGPKSALGVLAVGDVAHVKDSIASGDSDMLTKVSGIGKKTAERVVMELRDKVVGLSLSAPRVAGGSSSNADEIDALMALGYSMMQARDALKNVDASIKESGERIREALRSIKN